MYDEAADAVPAKRPVWRALSRSSGAPFGYSLPKGPPPRVYQIRVGIYDSATQTRYGIRDLLNDVGGNTLMLQSLEVR